MAQVTAKPKKAPALKGLARAGSAVKSKDKTSMTIESPNVVDLSDGKFPKVPPKPAQPQLPVDDAFKARRVSQA